MGTSTFASALGACFVPAVLGLSDLSAALETVQSVIDTPAQGTATAVPPAPTRGQAGSTKCCRCL